MVDSFRQLWYLACELHIEESSLGLLEVMAWLMAMHTAQQSLMMQVRQLYAGHCGPHAGRNTGCLVALVTALQ